MVLVKIVRTLGLPLPGRLSYQVSDSAFDFQPANISEPSVLLFGSIQLEADSNGRCRYAWGYSPHQGWTLQSLPVLPDAHPGICHIDEPLEPGLVVDAAAIEDTVTTFDPDAGKLLIRCVPSADLTWACEIAEGVVLLGEREGSLAGLLLAPTNSEQLENAIAAANAVK